MTIYCPQCSSTRIQTKNLGRKTDSAIGALAGAARGASLGSAGGQSVPWSVVSPEPSWLACSAVLLWVPAWELWLTTACSTTTSVVTVATTSAGSPDNVSYSFPIACDAVG